MHSTQRNKPLIVLFVVVFAVMFDLEARQASMPSNSTTVGLDKSFAPALKTKPIKKGYLLCYLLSLLFLSCCGS